MGKGYSKTTKGSNLITSPPSFKNTAKDGEGNKATSHGITRKEAEQKTSDKLADKRGDNDKK